LDYYALNQSINLLGNKGPKATYKSPSSYGKGWLGSRVVSVLDTGAEGSGFNSQP